MRIEYLDGRAYRNRWPRCQCRYLRKTSVGNEAQQVKRCCCLTNVKNLLHIFWDRSTKELSAQRPQEYRMLEISNRVNSHIGEKQRPGRLSTYPVYRSQASKESISTVGSTIPPRWKTTYLVIRHPITWNINREPKSETKIARSRESTYYHPCTHDTCGRSPDDKPGCWMSRTPNSPFWRSTQP